MPPAVSLSKSPFKSTVAVSESGVPVPPRLPHVISLLLVSMLAVYVGWANFWYAYDDALITYRVAYNFASGQGFVYNPGEWFLGITTPGLALLLGLVARAIGPDTVPLLGAIVSSVSLWLAGLALYVYGSQRGHPAGGLFAGLLLIGHPMIAITFGGEMPLQIALILWAFVACTADRRIAAALLLAAATIVRIDAALAAIVIGLNDLVQARRIDWRMWIVFALTLLPFAALAWYAFGSPLPVTLAAKLAQRDSGFWMTFGRGLRDWLHNVSGPNSTPAMFEIFTWDPRAMGFWVAVGIPALLWYRVWWLPFAWVLAFNIGYRTLKVPFYHWYAAPAIVGVSILAAAGIEAALVLLARFISARGVSNTRATSAIAAVAGLLLCIGINYHHLRMLPITSRPYPLVEIYEEAGRWLEANTPPDATIGYHEIGFLGYYAHRHVIDPLGLLDPAIPPHIAKQDFLWAYRERQPTYILVRDDDSPLGYGGIRGQAWFQRNYMEIRRFTTPRVPRMSVTVYQRVALH
jgi:hypothetical protein